MALEPDIVERVHTDFGRKSDEALHLLRGSGKAGRVARCIVMASRGSLARLKKYIELARLDYRDAITAGEYDSGRVRDLRVSFLLDSPEKFWIGEVACMMSLRDYTLVSVETRPAPLPPFVDTADRHEGRARFVGPEGDIELERRNRQWSILADPGELEKYNLNHPFEDEAAFLDAVSGWILMRRFPGATLGEMRTT